MNYGQKNILKIQQKFLWLTISTYLLDLSDLEKRNFWQIFEGHKSTQLNVC